MIETSLSNVIDVTEGLGAKIVSNITGNVCMVSKKRKNYQNERKNNHKLKNFYNSG